MKVKKRGRRLNRSLGGDIAINTFLIIFGLFMALPMVYSISSSLKPLDELWVYPPRFFVNNPTLKNYSDLFNLLSNSRIPFTKYIFNTVFVSVAGTFGHTVLASMCAYALCKHKFHGQKLIFNVIVLSLMFNTTVTAIPNFIIMSGLGWVDTLASLVVPAFGAPLGLYLMKQFMEQIPSSLLEAAKIDGAGELRIFWTIVMPNVKPAWLTLMVFSVTTLWNTGASNFIYDEYLKTLPYAVTQIVSAGLSRAGAGSAASVLMMSVPILCFVITQNNIIETMASSGIKE